jgi:hypothetical protein
VVVVLRVFDDEDMLMMGTFEWLKNSLDAGWDFLRVGVSETELLSLGCNA